MAVQPRLKELLLQSLEHERGGVIVYQTALECARNDDLRQEWEKYLAQTREHVTALLEVCTAMGIDPHEMTPGRKIVHHTGTSLVVTMKMALAAADPVAAELVVCECVVLAEAKDHFDWELIGEVSKELSGDQQELVQQAYERIEEEEDEHLYHTQGWARELWLESLGLPAELPPPEEKEHVTSAVEAQQAREGAHGNA